LSALDTFKKRMSATSGSNMRDEIIKNSKQLLQSTFLDDASANPYITFWNTENKLICRIFGRKKSADLIIATVQTYIDSTLTVGDILYDSNDKEYWMCTNLFNVDDVHKQGELTLCNFTLLFQSPTGTILSYPCIDDVNSSVGIDANNTITTLNGIHRIKLPFDDNTKLINTDRRFFIDDLSVEIPQVFAVSKPNRTEFKFGDKGLIELTMKQDAYNSQTDRKDLGVCNYFEPTVTPTPPDPTVPTEIVTITSDTEDDNIKLGLLYTFSALFTNELGQSVTDAVGQYSIDSTYGGLVVMTDNGDGTCTVQVDDDAYDLLTNEVVLSCLDVTNNYSNSVTLTIIGFF
jgi:hypothetical protein